MRMPKALLLTSILPWLIVCTTAGAADDANPEGLKLAQAIYDRPNGDDFAASAIMTLTEKGREPRQRQMYTMRVDRGAGERWSLTRFTDPADIKGVGLLTKDYPGDENDQWLYLPALDRVRRVSSSRKGGRFVGSDMFFEDLRDREVSMDHHKYLGKGKIGSLVCEVLQSVPVDPDNSVYTRRVSWIHPQTMVPLRVDLYQRHSNEPIKRLVAKRIKKIEGFWTVTESVMQDLESGHETRIQQTRVKYNQGIPGSLFTSRTLSDEAAETRYRP